VIAGLAAASIHVVPLGRSVRGRAIDAVEVAAPNAHTSVLVVGCIHGDEPAGIAVARALEHARPPAGVALWIVPDLNPDGVAADTRQNADGVDLNRNFPWRWRDMEGVFDSGERPLSEPEARIAYRLILRIHPAVSIWFHQHESVVDDSTGSRPVERAFAAIAHLPLRALTRYGGSVITWQSHRFPQSSPFVVELPGGTPPPTQVQRYVRAVLSAASFVAAH
jgi:murein peptide amidase A